MRVVPAQHFGHTHAYTDLVTDLRIFLEADIIAVYCFLCLKDNDILIKAEKKILPDLKHSIFRSNSVTKRNVSKLSLLSLV